MTIVNGSLPAAICDFDWRHAERALVAVGQPGVGIAVVLSNGPMITTATTVLRATTGEIRNSLIKTAALDDSKWRGAMVGVLSCDIISDLALLGAGSGIDDGFNGLDDLLREREKVEVAELVVGDAMVLHIPTVSGLWARLPGVITSDLDMTITARPVDEDAAGVVADWAGMPAFSNDGRLARFLVRSTSTQMIVRRVDHLVRRDAHIAPDDHEVSQKPPKRPTSARRTARSSHLCPGMTTSESVYSFMTVAEAAAEARVSSKRMRTLMNDGTLREGIHFTRPPGLRPRIIREELLRWLRGEAPSAPSSRRSPGRSKLNPALIRPARRPSR